MFTDFLCQIPTEHTIVWSGCDDSNILPCLIFVPYWFRTISLLSKLNSLSIHCHYTMHQNSIAGSLDNSVSLFAVVSIYILRQPNTPTSPIWLVIIRSHHSRMSKIHLFLLASSRDEPTCRTPMEMGKLWDSNLR